MSYKKITKKIYQEPIIAVIFINVIAIMITFLLFEPTMKSDDYDMCNLLYGGVSGQYESQLLYSSILWGKLLVGLLKIFPEVAWYTILQYILIVCALVCVDLILLERQHKFYFPLFCLSLFLSYEFMIRFTFSKTAGLLMITGFLFLLNTLEERKKWGQAVLGVAFLFMGMIIRLSTSYFFLISVIFLGALIISCIENRNRKNVLKQIVCFACVEIALFGLCLGVTYFSHRAFEQNENWENYLEINTARALVVDYEIPDYDIYQENYEALGISYNDYIMWFQNGNRGDSERLTENIYRKIGAFVKGKGDQTRISVAQITRNLAEYIANNTVAYVFLTLVFALIIISSRWNRLVLGVMSVDFIFCYGYMYSQGRIQHHIDAVLMLGIIVVILYYAQFDGQSRKDRIRIVTAGLCVIALFCYKFSRELISNSYYGNNFSVTSMTQKEYYQKNYEDNVLMSNDKEHLYVVESFDTNTTYPCFTPLEVFKKNFYSNIYRPNMNHISVYEDEVRKYGIENIYKEITNSNVIYYVTSDYTDNKKDVTLKYIQQNYNPDAKIRLVKKLKGLNIYQFYDNEIDVSDQIVQNIDDTFSVKITTSVENGKLVVSGYAFQEDTNSYSQKVYIKLTNVNDEGGYWYVATQFENEKVKSEDLYHGRYSKFESEIDLGMDKINSYQVNVYLENQNGLFALD